MKFIPEMEVCQQLSICLMLVSRRAAAKLGLQVMATQWSGCRCLQQTALSQMLQTPSRYKGYHPPEMQLTCRAESLSSCHQSGLLPLLMLLLQSIPCNHDDVRQLT